MENITHIETNQAYDAPDNRDYTYEEVFGLSGNNDSLPEEYMLDKVPNIKQTGSSCTVVGLLNVTNETFAQLVESATGRTDWEWIWDKAKERGATEKNGWSLQGALQLFKDLDLIGGYVRVAQPGEMNVDILKTIIAKEKKAIYTGVAIANWQETVRTHIYTTKGASLLGHAFDGTGYNKDGLFSGNSFGENGYFTLKYEDFHHLFSCYIVLPNNETEKLIEAKKKRKNIYLQKAFDKKIWNEERPNDTCTPDEKYKMIMRALNVPEDFELFKKHANLLLNDKMLRGKYMKLYHIDNDYDIITVNDFSKMFDRAAKRDSSIEDAEFTREEVATIVARDFL